MKAFLILEDGHIFTGTAIGSQREVIRSSFVNALVSTPAIPVIPFCFKKSFSPCVDLKLLSCLESSLTINPSGHA